MAAPAPSRSLVRDESGAATLHLWSGVGSGEVQCWLTGKCGDQEECSDAKRGEFNGESRGGNVFVHGEVLVFSYS